MDARGPILLSIEDDYHVRRSIVHYFEDNNYQVFEADNGRQGLDLFQLAGPDVVLVDLRMPGLDGLDVIQAMVQRSPDTPIVVVSGTGVIDDAIKAVRAGAWDFVTKPIEDMAVLEHAVNKVLERARLLRENRDYQSHLEREVEARTAELEHLYESSPVGIGLCDSQQRFVRINRKLAEIGGGDVSDGVHQTIRQVVPCLADVLESLHQFICRSKEPALNLEAHDGGSDRNSPSRSWLISGHPVELTDRSMGVGFIVQDITDLRRQEERRLELERQLRHAQKMEAVGTLAAGIAHDFNNLLTGIAGYTEFVKDTLPEEHPARRPLQVVEQAVHDASGITNSLLTFSRKTVTAKSAVDMAKALHDTVDLMKHVLPASIQLRVLFAPDQPVYVKADLSQIHQMIMNLLTNARDALPQGGSIDIDLQRMASSESTEEPLAESALLTVADNGMGMTPEVLSQVFNPFFTTKPRGKGTGLGMAMIHAIVRDHQGQISIQSRPGEGTRIEIRLPCCAPELFLPADKEKPLSASQAGLYTLLLAEGNEFVRAILLQTLQKDYRVLQCCNCREVEALLDDPECRYDLAILDADLPGECSQDCYNKICTTKPDLPIIMTSGNPDFRWSPSDVRPGARDILLRKPFHMSDLRQMIGHLLAVVNDPE